MGKRIAQQFGIGSICYIDDVELYGILENIKKEGGNEYKIRTLNDVLYNCSWGDFEFVSYECANALFFDDKERKFLGLSIKKEDKEWKEDILKQDLPLYKDDSEKINHPSHYGGKDNPYEAIKVIEAWELDFCLGNTVKYISRHGKKGSKLEDLKKAQWYLNREIANCEKEKK